jgi:serine/threonine-protein kinase
VAIKVLPRTSPPTPIASRASIGKPGCSPRSIIPNIGAIYGLESLPQAGGASRQPAIVLEFVDGESLSDYIARSVASRETTAYGKEVLTIARQICDALDAAHERGIIHRDLKPANIKLTSAVW